MITKTEAKANPYPYYSGLPHFTKPFVQCDNAPFVEDVQVESKEPYCACFLLPEPLHAVASLELCLTASVMPFKRPCNNRFWLSHMTPDHRLCMLACDGTPCCMCDICMPYGLLN